MKLFLIYFLFKIEVSAEMAKYCIEKAKEAKMMDQSELINSEKRQFDMIMKIGTANLTVLEHQQVYFVLSLKCCIGSCR